MWLLCVRACDVRAPRVQRASASSAHSCFSPGAEAGAGLANGIAAVRAADILNLDPFPLPEPELEVLEVLEECV